MMGIIEIKRLILRTLNESEVDKVLNNYKKNKDFFEPWIPKYEGTFYTYENQ